MKMGLDKNFPQVASIASFEVPRRYSPKTKRPNSCPSCLDSAGSFEAFCKFEEGLLFFLAGLCDQCGALGRRAEAHFLLNTRP